MPRVVSIPQVGDITFPDSMSDEELNRAVKKLHDEAATPKKIGTTPTPTLTAPSNAATTPGGVTPPPPGAKGGLLGGIQDVGISAAKTVTGTATSAAKFLTHGAFPLGGSVPDEIVRLANAGQKSIDNWLESTRTEKPPKQPKIPVLGQTPTEAIGMIAGGAMIPLPGGGSTGETLMARALGYIKSTLFGTAAFTAVQALPEYLEAATPAERDAIVSSLPQSVVGQFLVAAGMFGAHEFYGRVTAKQAPFVAAVTEQNGQVPEAFKKPKMTAEEVVKAGIKTGQPALDNVKSMDEHKVERDMPSPEDRQARYKEISDKQSAPVPDNVRTFPVKEEPTPKMKKILESRNKVETQLLLAREQHQLAVDEKTSPAVIERLKGSVQHWENRLAFHEKSFLDAEKEAKTIRAKRAEMDAAAKDLSETADEAHAGKLVDKGVVEEKIATENKSGGGKGGPPPEPPATAYEGDFPPPATGFLAAFKRLFNPVSLAPKDFVEQWEGMWNRIDGKHWDADRGRDQEIKLYPDEKVRKQMGRYMAGLPGDGALSVLDGPAMKHAEAARATMTAAIQTGRDSGTFSASRMLDVLSGMYANPKEALGYFNRRGVLSKNGGLDNKAFADMDPGVFFEFYKKGIDSGLKPATHDIANFVNNFEVRFATANAQQALKLAVKAMPGVAVPRNVGAPPEGFVTPKSGHMQGYYVHRDVAAAMDSLRMRSAWDENDIGKFYKKTQQGLKRAAVALSGFHHQAMFRTSLATGHFDPDAAVKGLGLIERNDPVVKELAARGLQVFGSRQDIGEILKNELRGYDPNKLQKAYEWWDDVLWQKAVPGYIAFAGKNYAGELVRAHPDWDMERVYKVAVEKTNTEFGLQAVERTGRSKTVQDTLRALMFAPTWTETRLKMFYGAALEGKGLVTRQGTLTDTMYLRQTLGHTLVAGVLAELAHQAMWAMSGKSNPDESTRRFGEFTVPWWTDKRGKPLIVDTLMYLREPFEMVKESVKAVTMQGGHPGREVSKYVLGRRNQLIAWGMEELANGLRGEDFKGQTIRRPEASTWDQITATIGHTASHTIPIIAQHAADAIDLMHMQMNDFKGAVARDLASAAGFRSRTDYPIELRLTMESQIRNHPVYLARIKNLREAGDYEGAKKLASEFNKRADAIAIDIKDQGFSQTLGPWWSKNQRFARIR
jgi:hypothetical protein